jgi:hypothetical protein
VAAACRGAGLVDHADREFERLGLAFPYLAERVGSTAVQGEEGTGQQQGEAEGGEESGDRTPPVPCGAAAAAPPPPSSSSSPSSWLAAPEGWQRRGLTAIDIEHSLCCEPASQRARPHPPQPHRHTHAAAAAAACSHASAVARPCVSVSVTLSAWAAGRLFEAAADPAQVRR